MTSLAIWVSSPYQGNALFDPASPLNRDDCLAPFRILKQEMEKQRRVCSTIDQFNDETGPPSDILFLDIPANIGKLATQFSDSRFYLLIQECEVLIPRNWDEKLHDHFDSVFTWSPELYSRTGKYCRAHFSQVLRFEPSSIPFEDKKLCTLICANKRSTHPQELYSKRKQVIDWFEDNDSDVFDLYGVGWDRLSSDNRYLNKLLQLSGVGRLLAPKLRTYGGMVDKKSTTLHNYRFAFCYENAHSIAGYVTEKIFDVMMAGVVPVYIGAPDITDYVPADCFIDPTKFSNQQALVSYLQAMSAEEHSEILGRIERYLESESARLFSAKYFADTLSKRICSFA
ncbi:MAG: glycosyltransferase family 10 [Motiliproteus sp.]|nr:glycosyltransferase family 10 [Motiliproteus sp.]